MNSPLGICFSVSLSVSLECVVSFGLEMNYKMPVDTLLINLQHFRWAAEKLVRRILTVKFLSIIDCKKTMTYES